MHWYGTTSRPTTTKTRARTTSVATWISTISILVVGLLVLARPWASPEAEVVQTTTSKPFEIDEPALVFQLPPQMPEAEGPPAAAELQVVVVGAGKVVGACNHLETTYLVELEKSHELVVVTKRLGWEGEERPQVLYLRPWQGTVDFFCAELDRHAIRVPANLQERKAECHAGANADGNGVFNWMRDTSRTPISKLVLLGSHDAGTYASGSHHVPMMCNLGSAATQSVDILGQLCAGYRVFDLRFKKSTVDNKFRIHHPPLAFTFAESDDIADQVKTFCTMPKHANEIIMLRLKVAGATEEEGTAFINSFAIRIGDCVMVRRVANVPPHIGDQNLEQLRGASESIRRPGQPQKGAMVLMMPYGVTFAAETTGEDIDADDIDTQIRMSFNYKQNMGGRYSQSLSVNKIETGQTKNYNAWIAGNPRTPLLFGWWETLTASPIPDKTFFSKDWNIFRTWSHGTNVLTNTKKLFAPNKHGKWYERVLQILTKNAAATDGAGMVVWTDFGGNPGMAEAEAAIIAFNQGGGHHLRVVV